VNLLRQLRVKAGDHSANPSKTSIATAGDYLYRTNQPPAHSPQNRNGQGRGIL